jgi:hypothetical protein
MGININLPVTGRNNTWYFVFFPYSDYSSLYRGSMYGQTAQLSILLFGSGHVNNGSLNFESTGAINVNVPSDVSVFSAANNGPASYVMQGDLVSVPEPASIAIMISGLLLISIFRINRRVAVIELGAHHIRQHQDRSRHSPAPTIMSARSMGSANSTTLLGASTLRTISTA